MPKPPIRPKSATPSLMDPATFNPRAGHPDRLAPDLVRVLAPNASPMTFRGTNSYLLGRNHLAVIDPGPDDPRHLQALLAAIDARPVSAILVTHSHVDHSTLAPELARITGALVMAFGDSRAGRSAAMAALAKTADLGGGEGVDHAFKPDCLLADGARIMSADGSADAGADGGADGGAEWTLTAHWTPGHFGNHMCFSWRGGLFSGDHVMGWASSLVSPPDGDLSAFMGSCERLLLRNDQTYYPGHGAPIEAPAARLTALIAHRKQREHQILAALAQGGPATAPGLAAAIYTDVSPALLPMAARNVLAHLIDLAQRNKVETKGAIAPDSLFARKTNDVTSNIDHGKGS